MRYGCAAYTYEAGWVAGAIDRATRARKIGVEVMDYAGKEIILHRGSPLLTQNPADCYVLTVSTRNAELQVQSTSFRFYKDQVVELKDVLLSLEWFLSLSTRQRKRQSLADCPFVNIARLFGHGELLSEYPRQTALNPPESYSLIYFDHYRIPCSVHIEIVNP